MASDVNVRAIITAEDQATSVIKGLGSSLAALGGIVSLTKIIDEGKQLVGAFNASQAVATQLNAVLKSTGDISGVTAGEATKLSEELAHVTTFSHESVLEAENLLLTFTNIGKTTFPEATKAVLDMSTALGQDTRDSAIQLGKALQDPVLGVTALRRVGVAFNETQRQTISNLVETGHGLEAQKMILKEVETEFGGSAEAIGQTFGGQLKILQNDLHDTQESMGQVLSAGFGPLVDGITNFVAHNQELVTSFGVALLAAGAFAAGIVTLVGAVGLAVTILGGPLTLVLGILSALLGGVVFAAVEKFQQKMQSATASVTEGSKQMATNGANNFGATGKAASDLAQKLADIKEQMDQTTADFQQSLLTIVQSNEQKLAGLKSQLSDENQAFAEAQAQKSRDYEKSRLDLAKQDVLKIGMTKDVAAQAEAIQQQQLAILDAQYAADTANAEAAHKKKVDALQASLDDETAFMMKHQADIRSVQNIAALDEIDKLKQSYARQLEAFDKQKQAAIQSAQQTTAGMANSFNGLPSQIQGGLLNGVGSQLGRDMANALKQTFIDTMKNLPNDVGNWGKSLGNTFSEFGRFIMGKAPFPHNAQGTSDWGGGVTWVGENGPELVNLPAHSQVIPNDKIGPGGGAGTVNLNVNIGMYAGTEMEKRKIAVALSQALQAHNSARGIA